MRLGVGSLLNRFVPLVASRPSKDKSIPINEVKFGGILARQISR